MDKLYFAVTLAILACIYESCAGQCDGHDFNCTHCSGHRYHVELKSLQPCSSRKSVVAYITGDFNAWKNACSKVMDLMDTRNKYMIEASSTESCRWLEHTVSKNWYFTSSSNQQMCDSVTHYLCKKQNSGEQTPAGLLVTSTIQTTQSASSSPPTAAILHTTESGHTNPPGANPQGLSTAKFQGSSTTESGQGSTTISPPRSSSFEFARLDKNNHVPAMSWFPALGGKKEFKLVPDEYKYGDCRRACNVGNVARADLGIAKEGDVSDLRNMLPDGKYWVTSSDGSSALITSIRPFQVDASADGNTPASCICSRNYNGPIMTATEYRLVSRNVRPPQNTAPLAKKRAGSMAICARACNQHPDCGSFDLEADSNTCSLYEGMLDASATVQTKGVDYFVKDHCSMTADSFYVKG